MSTGSRDSETTHSKAEEAKVGGAESGGEMLPRDATGRTKPQGWWSSKRNVILMLIALVATAAVLTPLGFVSNLRPVVLGIVGTGLGTILFPIVLVLLGLALFATLFGLLLALLTDGASLELGVEVIKQGARLIPWWTSTFSKVHHPVFWGVVVGLFLSGLILGGTWLIGSGGGPGARPTRMSRTQLSPEAQRPAAAAARANARTPWRTLKRVVKKHLKEKTIRFLKKKAAELLDRVLRPRRQRE